MLACPVILLVVWEDRVREGRIKRNDLCPAGVDHHSRVVIVEIHDVADVQVREINTVHT